MKEKPESLSTEHPGRRVHPRYVVDAVATLVLLNHGAIIETRIVDLSIGGCLLRAARAVHVPASTRVEVRFAVHGLPFRLGGSAQWTDGKHMVGVRFAEMSSRRRQELAELLAEIQADQAAAESELAKDELPATSQVEPAANAKSPVAKTAEDSVNGAQGVEKKPAAPTAINSVPAGQPSPRERRTQTRHSIDSKATILLVDVGSKETGRIVDVSLSGCRIRTDQRFPVGIYRRVEVEFTLDGLPFRLGGVTQSLHDKHTVGIRLVDLSERKREQLTHLIQEIEQMRKQESSTVKNPTA